MQRPCIPAGRCARRSHENHSSTRTRRSRKDETGGRAGTSTRAQTGAGAAARQRRQFHRRVFPHRRCTRPICRSLSAMKGQAWWRRLARRSPRWRRAIAWPMPWLAVPTREYAVVPAAVLVKIPDHLDFTVRGGRHAAGHDRPLPDAFHLPAEDGRYLPGARRGGRRGRPDRADGENAGRARVRHRFHGGEGGDCPRSRRRRNHSLHAAGFRSRGETSHRRPRRGRGVRFGGQDHLREEPELAAPARPDGAVRAVQRRRCRRSIRTFSTAKARCS